MRGTFALWTQGRCAFRREHFCHSERKCQSGSDRGISNSFLVTWGLSPSLDIKKIRRRRQNVDSCEQNARATLQTPKHCHQQIYRQNPDQDDLPEPQITCAVMIACDIRVARKKFFSIFENVNPGKDNSDEADTEKNPQWQDRIGMRTNHGKERAHQWMIRKP